MEIKPFWLPELFDISQWTNNTYDELYQIFSYDFILNKTRFNKKNIVIPKQKENNKELTFWHVTTRQEKNNDERFPDLRRCERLPWLKPMLENANDPEVLVWEYQEGSGKIQTYVWLKEP